MLQEAAGEDMTLLYLAERHGALEQAAVEKMTRLSTIPGMLVMNPAADPADVDAVLGV